MKQTLTLLLMIALAGCNPTRDDTGKDLEFGVQIVKIRGCDYALYIKPTGATMVHAGDCSNPIHATSSP